MPPVTPPKTRALQTWSRFWQRYGGELPADLRVYNEKVAPSTRNVITRIAKDGPVPKSLLGTIPKVTAEASAGGEVSITGVTGRTARRFIAIPAALGTLLLFCVDWVLYHSWKVTFGPVLSSIAGVGIRYKHWPVDIDIHPFGFLEDVNRKTQNFLAKDMRSSERAFVWCVNTFLEPIILIVGTILAIGYALWYGLRAAEHAIAHRIPKTITHTIVRPIQKTVQKIEVQTKTRVRVIEKTVTVVRTRVNYITKAALVQIKPIRLRLGRVETRLKKDEHAIAQLQKKVAVAGFTGLFFSVLAKTGLDWLRCRNVSRLGRGVCRMNPNLLRYLLGSAFEAFAVFDLCGLIKAEVKLAEWFQPLMMELVDVDEWLIQNCGYTKAPPLTLPAVRLPAGSYGVALNAERDYLVGLAT